MPAPSVWAMPVAASAVSVLRLMVEAVIVAPVGQLMPPPLPKAVESSEVPVTWFRSTVDRFNVS
jgi:hypothetical protein